MADKLFDLISQPYERKARATPGLLAVIPVLTAFLCYYGPKQPLVAAVVGLLASCGAIYALASLARMTGKKREEALIRKWGGRPTTIALRHRDTFLDVVTKQRYHQDIVRKLDIQMPTEQQEQANPDAADQQYMGATRRLIELTRGDKGLLLMENINYGFARNMLGLKPVGVAASVLGLAYGLLFAKVLQIAPAAVHIENLAAPGIAGSITMTVSLAMLLVWTISFRANDVRRVGFVYAERLFEHLPKLSVAKKAAKKAAAVVRPEDDARPVAPASSS